MMEMQVCLLPLKHKPNSIPRSTPPLSEERSTPIAAVCLSPPTHDADSIVEPWTVPPLSRKGPRLSPLPCESMMLLSILVTCTCPFAVERKDARLSPSAL